MTDVTVLLPVKHLHHRWFTEAVDSLRNQTLSRIEVLILATADHDDFERVVDSLADSRMKVIRCEASDSITEQLNRGIELSCTDLVARADADDVNEPWRLERQVDFLNENPEVDVLGTSITIIDARSRPVARRRYAQTHEQIRQQMHRTNSIAHPSVMFRKRSVQAAGGYQFSGRPAQDYELWSRMIHAGYQLANLPDFAVRYRMHHDSVKSRRLKATLQSTLIIKRTYWLSSMGIGDHVRMSVERCLRILPSKIVHRIFQWWTTRGENVD